MKTFLALVAMATVLYGYADAGKVSKYQSVYQSCMDYGHSARTRAETKACREQAKTEVLTTFGAYQNSWIVETRPVAMNCCLEKIPK